jgi:hypothetical protein
MERSSYQLSKQEDKPREKGQYPDRKVQLSAIQQKDQAREKGPYPDRKASYQLSSRKISRVRKVHIQTERSSNSISYPAER